MLLPSLLVFTPVATAVRSVRLLLPTRLEEELRDELLLLLLPDTVVREVREVEVPDVAALLRVASMREVSEVRVVRREGAEVVTEDEVLWG